jgi:hypothetical protein
MEFCHIDKLRIGKQVMRISLLINLRKECCIKENYIILKHITFVFLGTCGKYFYHNNKKETYQTLEGGNQLLRIRNVTVSNLGHDIGYPDNGFRDFAQKQSNAGIVGLLVVCWLSVEHCYAHYRGKVLPSGDLVKGCVFSTYFLY